MVPAETPTEATIEAKRQLRAQVNALFPYRRNRALNKSQFAEEYRELLEKQLAPQVAADPLLALQDAVQTSLTVLALAMAVEKRGFSIRSDSGNVRAPRGLQKLLDDRERRFERLFGQLIDIPELEKSGSHSEESGNVKIEARQVKRLFLHSAFLRVFTAIEVYLQDSLVRALADPKAFRRFSSQIPEDDIPTRWEDGSRIRKFEYATRWNDVITAVLRFPYHDFEGKVSHRYRDCFGFDLVKFKGLKRLVHFRNIRNVLVHQGSTRLGMPLVEIAESDVTEIVRLGLQLADFIESRGMITQKRKGNSGIMPR